MRKGRGGGRVSVVVGGHVDGLHRGDRPLFGRGDALLQLPHLLGQVRLVAYGGGHAAQQRRDLRASLREAEDVVDEEQHVAPLGIAEILGDGQAAERHAQARPRRLIHLPEDHRQLVKNLGVGHLVIEVIALACALAYTGENREATENRCPRRPRHHPRRALRSWRCC